MNEIIYLSAGNGQFVEAERVERVRTDVRASLYVGAQCVAAFIGNSESEVTADAMAWIAMFDEPSANYSLKIVHETVEEYLLIAPKDLLAAPAADVK